jgi:hypothetical protein
VSLIAVVALVLATAAPVPSGYEGAVGALPPGHWALVSRVDLIDEHDGHTYGDRRIEIPRKPDADILTHEVGHVVAIAHPELEAAYLARFERHGNLGAGVAPCACGRVNRPVRIRRPGGVGGGDGNGSAYPILSHYPG